MAVLQYENYSPSYTTVVSGFGFEYRNQLALDRLQESQV
jgi:hypothetical protein